MMTPQNLKYMSWKPWDPNKLCLLHVPLAASFWSSCINLGSKLTEEL